MVRCDKTMTNNKSVLLEAKDDFLETRVIII